MTSGLWAAPFGDYQVQISTAYCCLLVKFQFFIILPDIFSWNRGRNRGKKNPFQFVKVHRYFWRVIFIVDDTIFDSPIYQSDFIKYYLLVHLLYQIIISRNLFIKIAIGWKTIGFSRWDETAYSFFLDFLCIAEA